MARRKKEKPCPKGAPEYMLTYGDMITLLLTFFVFMFTTAEINGRDFRLILSAFRGSLGIFTGGTTLSKGRLEEMGMNLEMLPAQTAGRALSKSFKEAVSMFEPEIATKRVQVREEERGIVISLMNDAYFAPGSAALSPQLRKTLVKVGKLLKRIPTFCRIEGHTDNNPIPITGVREGYETNWELAGARAIHVLRYLSEYQGVNPEKMSAVSFGATRPLFPNDTPEHRSFNRRTDIVILKRRFHPSGPRPMKTPLPDEEWRFPTR